MKSSNSKKQFLVLEKIKNDFPSGCSVLSRPRGLKTSQLKELKTPWVVQVVRLRESQDRRARRDECLTGFTLIEAMLAMLVLTIGIVAVLQVFPLGFDIGKSGQIKSQAALLAQEKIEEMASKSYGDIPIGAQTEPSLSHPFERFARQTEVIYVDANLNESAADTGLKKVTVLISWTPLPFGASNLFVATLIANQ